MKVIVVCVRQAARPLNSLELVSNVMCVVVVYLRQAARPLSNGLAFVSGSDGIVSRSLFTFALVRRVARRPLLQPRPFLALLGSVASSSMSASAAERFLADTWEGLDELDCKQAVRSSPNCQS